MPNMKSRIPYGPLNPYRPNRPKTSKIIFLALEGRVTEEQYFERVNELFSEIKSKIQFISVAEDAVHTIEKYRTSDQNKLLSKCRPIQLVERINQFKLENDEKYQFSQYPDDEFWIVTDVDKNWSNEIINSIDGKTYKDEWNDAIAQCEEKNYKYAISNPFFEVWLLLHHDDVTDDDKKFAVTDEHEYEHTNHFLERLRDLGAPLKNQKTLDASHYDKCKIIKAISRAEKLHSDKNDSYPKYLSSTVYLLLSEIVRMFPENMRDEDCN